MKSELYNEDCLDVLDHFIKEGRKVDCIITSPPYNMNLRVMKGKYVSRTRYKRYREEFSTKYDNFSDDLSMEEYYVFLCDFMERALKVTDLVFLNSQLLTGNKVALLRFLGTFADDIKDIIIWNKCNAQPAMKEGVLNSQYEFIIVFDNNKPYNRMFDKYNFKRGTETNLWDIKRERNPYIKASFPEALVKRLLLDFTNEGDTVMDPFMGSGTAGLVCERFNRNFIGVELDKHYFDIAKSRLGQ